MTEPTHTIECFLCKQSFEFGPHRFDGRRLREWDAMVCGACYRNRHDGIVPGTYPRSPSHRDVHATHDALWPGLSDLVTLRGV